MGVVLPLPTNTSLVEYMLCDVVVCVHPLAAITATCFCPFGLFCGSPFLACTCICVTQPPRVHPLASAADLNFDRPPDVVGLFSSSSTSSSPTPPLQPLPLLSPSDTPSTAASFFDATATACTATPPTPLDAAQHDEPPALPQRDSSSLVPYSTCVCVRYVCVVVCVRLVAAAGCVSAYRLELRACLYVCLATTACVSHLLPPLTSWCVVSLLCTEFVTVFSCYSFPPHV